MWFKPEDLMTPALKRLMWLHNNQLEKRIIELFFEIFDSLDTEIIEVTPNDISNILRLYDKYRAPAAEIRKILKKNWNLKPQSNSMKYTRIIAGNYGDFMEVQSCKGRYYTIEKNFILGKYDELMIE